MSIVEISSPPGDMPPLHVHRTDDEAWVVLEGEVSFFAGSNEPIRVAAGGAAFGPKGVAHTYRVESDGPARILAICTPGDFAAFVIAASQPADRAELPPPPSWAADRGRGCRSHGTRGRARDRPSRPTRRVAGRRNGSLTGSRSRSPSDRPSRDGSARHTQGGAAARPRQASHPARPRPRLPRLAAPRAGRMRPGGCYPSFTTFHRFGEMGAGRAHFC